MRVVKEASVADTLVSFLNDRPSLADNELLLETCTHAKRNVATGVDSRGERASSPSQSYVGPHFTFFP